MFKFKRKDKHQERERESVRGSHKLLSTTSSSSSKLLRTTSTGTTAASSSSSKRATATYDEAQQQRIARFNSTSTTMLSDDVEDVFYARGGTEVYIGDGTTSTVPRALDSSRSTNSNMSYDDDSSTYSGYSGYSSDSSTRSTGTYRTTATNGRTTEQLRATGLETLNELEEDVSVDRSTARYVGAGPMPPYTSAMASNTPVMQSAINGGDASALRAELADLKLEMQAIKREMMNEMHLTRYDVLKEVTMLKGTIQQLVSILHTSGGVQYDAQAAAALGVELPPVAPELAPHEKEALSRRTTTVTTKQTKERIASSREDQVPPVLRTTSSRLTQLMPVDDSALSTPLNQDQIDEMFPLVDGSIDVQVQARIRETGSREWVFDRVQDWLDSRFNVGADTVLGMVGDAGTGKTVAAAAVSDKFHEQVVAFHFCKFDKKNKSSPRNLLLSLVNQLTGSLPMFKSQLARLNLKYVLEETDVLVLARKVLVDPLMSLEEPLTAKVIVVDGIDQCRLPSGYNDLLSFLSVIIPECPKWLGFLVTSKPSPEFASTMPVSSVLDFSAKNPNYVNDAVCLINDIATVFHDDDVAQAKALLQSKSGGNYMYLEFTKQALTQPGMEEPEGHGGIPVDVLHDLPQSLFEIFDEIFEDKFGKGRTRLWRKALPVLQLIFTAAAGPYAQITEQHVMDSLSYSKDDVRMLRRAFIDIISIRQGTYCIASSALFDWLTDPQRKGESYHVDPTIHVKVLRRVLGGEKLNLPGTASGTPNTTSASPSPKQRATTSSSSSSTGSSERGSGGQRQPQTGTRVVSTAQVPVTRHEPNLHNPTKPVGILKRGSSRT